MQIEVAFGDVPWEPWDQRALQRRLRWLEAALHRYGLNEAARLYVEVRPFGDGDVRAEAFLNVPGETLRAEHVDTTLPGLERGVVEALRDEFDRYRLRVNPRLRARAAARRRRLQAPSPERGYAFRRLPEEKQAEFIERLLPRLRRVAAHEVALHQAQGDIEPGFVDPIDVVDDVLGDEFADQELADSLPALALRLENRIVERVHRLAREFEDARGANVPLETELRELSEPSTSEEMYVNDLATNMGDFWVLDEALRLEDTFTDPTSVDPETVVSEREGQEILVQGLFRLPDEMRRVFAAVIVDGWSPEEVAGARGERVSTVKGLIDEAAHRLARTLTGAPAYSSERVLELYTALGEALHRNPIRLQSS
jgi:DNA-directed RNA polymerase specialized sigma24 family protein